MKNYSIKTLILLLSVITIFTSCGDSDPNLNEIEDDLFLVSTLTPEVNDNGDVTFRGKTSNSLNGKLVRYGFMWYISDGDQITEPVRVPIGSTRNGVDFETNMSDLPKGLNLVVCSYLEVAEEGDNTTIGNEENFEVPL